MSQLAALKAATTLNDVARLLGYEAKGLSYILYKLPSTYKYSHFEVPKRFGGMRKISAPTAKLKLLQKRLSDLLQDCLKEIEETGGRRSSVAHGFKKNRSIASNAKRHRGRRFVFNVDLEDFFPSIHFGRVRGFFIKDNNFALDERVATIVAQIACDDNALPQGSPCSPVISNLVGHILDTHLVRLASAVGCRYTRYADDLTFSTNESEFPKSIAKRISDAKHEWSAGEELLTMVERSGFKTKSSKTRMQYRNARQEVTGLVVNRKVNVRSEYRHMVRAMTHRLLTKGNFEFVHQVIDASGARTPIKTVGTAQQLHGMLGFIDWIDSYNQTLVDEALGPAAPTKRGHKLKTKEAVYGRFLLFKEFYSAPMPVLLCEGRTDNVYMVHAIRNLVDQFPTLATKNAEGKITLKIRICKYSKSRKHKPGLTHEMSSTGRILGINGGAGDLKNFLFLYRDEVQRFRAPGAFQPVILLIDNDDGASSVYNSIKAITKKANNKTDPFIQVYRNLYVVPTPLSVGQEKSTIEDFFDDKTRGETIDNKTFNPGKDFDPEKHYGKQIFAQKIVKEKGDQIDFKGFTSLLSNISLTIDTHVRSHPQTAMTQ